MSDTRSGLLKAVIAAPDDDLPRLVFADWCDENGESGRGDFVRVLCHAAKCFPCRDCSRWSRRDCPEPNCVFGLHDRALALLLDHNWTPTKGMCQYIGKGRDDGTTGVFWDRGFIRSARCPLAMWLEHGPRLVREHPVERVVPTDREPWHNDRGSNPDPGVPEELRLPDVWVWLRKHTTDAPDDPYRLPLAIWNIVQRDAYATTVAYPTREEANAALSAALIAWAK